MTNHEPLIHIARRDGLVWWRAWCIRLAAAVLALLVSALFIYSITKLNPVKVYAAMWEGAFGSPRRAWVTARDASILLCIGVGLAPAFMMRFWNVGAEGQMLMGGCATAAVLIYGGGALSTFQLLLVSTVASVAAGALWGVIPALFKARWNTNETLFTLMMNYIAIQITCFLVALWEDPKGSNSVGVINQQTQAGWLPALFGKQYLLNVVIVLVLTVAMYLYLKYTKHGYEISVVGESENTARYAGISVKRVIVRTMALSGAVCGLSGFIAVAGASHQYRRRPGFHRHHRGLDGKVQHLRHGAHRPAAGVPGKGSRADRLPVPPERLRLRRGHRHHPFLPAGKRVLHPIHRPFPLSRPEQ